MEARRDVREGGRRGVVGREGMARRVWLVLRVGRDGVVVDILTSSWYGILWVFGDGFGRQFGDLMWKTRRGRAKLY